MVKCGYKIGVYIFNCQISPGLAQPVNQAASITESDNVITTQNYAIFRSRASVGLI